MLLSHIKSLVQSILTQKSSHLYYLLQSEIQCIIWLRYKFKDYGTSSLSALSLDYHIRFFILEVPYCYRYQQKYYYQVLHSSESIFISSKAYVELRYKSSHQFDTWRFSKQYTVIREGIVYCKKASKKTGHRTSTSASTTVLCLITGSRPKQFFSTVHLRSKEWALTQQVLEVGKNKCRPHSFCWFRRGCKTTMHYISVLKIYRRQCTETFCIECIHLPQLFTSLRYEQTFVVGSTHSLS